MQPEGDNRVFKENNQMYRTGIVVGLAIAIALSWGDCPARADNSDRIQPWSENPRYWQYKGQPVMLLGGSKTDHFFLLDDLKEHVDEIHAVGANYVRNTMSQREGVELKPYRLRPDGKFDLDQWNDDYWQRFENMLKWTHERDIFVQIEVWDRFDFSQTHWEISPWNPGKNVNYTYEQTGFSAEYPAHPSQDRQPFFHSIPGMPRYNKKLDLVRSRQEKFVAKMLSYSLQYGHVLYCMDNETSTPAAWGKYWIDFIKAKAAEKRLLVCTTDMFDDAYLGAKAAHAPIVFDDPEHYMFADISQVNSRNFDQAHWDQLQWMLKQVNRRPRPSNHTKVYGSGYKSFGTGGPEDGVERFWRNIIGGSASCRFHRPDSGNGLNDLAMGSIKAGASSKAKSVLGSHPHMELLSDRASNEAYLAAKPGRLCTLLHQRRIRRTRSVEQSSAYTVTWISVAMGIVVENSQASPYGTQDKTIRGRCRNNTEGPVQGGWVAAIVKK